MNMTRVTFFNGGYKTVVTVNQSREEIEKIVAQRTDNYVPVYTPLISRGVYAESKYNREERQVEYTGGRFYIGLGPALGWEYSIYQPVFG
jgi:hypothetical protein